MKNHEQDSRPMHDDNEWREAETDEIAREAGRRSPARTVRASTLVLASAVLAYVLLGCGQHRSQDLTQSTTESPGLVVAQAASTALPPTPATGGVEQGAASYEAVPPEVEASVPDSAVVRGSVVEVTAQGSSDVTSMTLKDDLGVEQTMTYDESAQLWHTYYRVPLKARSERVSLSVTAKNGTNRWRRVWVFVNTAHEAGREPVANPEQ